MTRILLLILLIPNITNAEVWPITEQDCFAANIYHEARGEPLVGQYMVGYVVMNRLRNDKYPDTICEVVKQSKQFSWFDPKNPKYPTDYHAWETAKSITVKFLLGHPVAYIDLSEGAIFYHASYMTPWWAKEKTFILEVAGHKFYR